MPYTLIGGRRRQLPRGVTNGRQRLVSVTGTAAIFECRAGHRMRKDFSKGPVSKRMSAAAVAFLAKCWNGSNDVAGWCQKCHNTRPDPRRSERA